MESAQQKKDLLKPAGREGVGPEHIRQSPEVSPDVDIIDRPGEIILRADMPGVDQGGVEVRFENGNLRVSGRQKAPSVGKHELVYQEFAQADFYREFEIGDGIEDSRVSAEYEDGVLTLRLPKSAALKPRKIEIRRKS